MKLYVHEIKSDGVFQTIKPKKNSRVGAIRPHLYIKNIPSGSLKVLVETPDGVVIGESEETEISEITSASEYHGYVTFYIGVYLKKGSSYVLRIVGANSYSFNESEFCGVCGDSSLRKYDTSMTSGHSIKGPLDFEIWTG
jgi:hypothetical protein